LDRKWTNIVIRPRDRASISVQQLRIKLYLTFGLKMDQYYNMAQGSSYHFGPTVTYKYKN
jgi:hypothetical protein